MSDWAIKVEGVGKLYRVGARAPYHRFTDLVTGLVRAPLSLLGSKKEKSPVQSVAQAEADPRFRDAPPGYFWSLRDISFEIPEGQVVGIIGRNGAGKSTLLKLMSRITEPTCGKIQVRGRVGSLLEVGTGFHPELSGRENIFLNGAILGMKRPEIRRKFDEIVAFAEVEKFLDSPVKHYSSGMYMRLAFAVAAHLEPEVLIVDEVLAVGDAQFQKKCLGKMGEVARSGRTVLFVSHNLDAISQLCNQCLHITDGTISYYGETKKALTDYDNRLRNQENPRIWPAESGMHTNEAVRLISVSCISSENTCSTFLPTNEPFRIEMTYEVLKGGTSLYSNFHFYTPSGVCLFVAVEPEQMPEPQLRDKGIYTCEALVPANIFAPGEVWVNIALSTFKPMKVHFHVIDAMRIVFEETADPKILSTGYSGPLPGIIRPQIKWDSRFRRAPEEL